jgi:hypothetical protein
MTPAEQLLNMTLDCIQQQDLVASLARSLHAAGVTEEMLLKVINDRGDLIAADLHGAFLDAQAGRPTTNRYGVVQ